MSEWLTLGEVAQKLRLKPDTVRRFYIQAGKLQATKFGRQWRINADDLERLMAEQQRHEEPPLA